MRSLILCDEGNVLEAARACAHGFGIEVQAFFDPCYIESAPDAVEIHQEAIKNIRPRAMHAPFWNLFPGSRDPMVREVARYRFETAYGIGSVLGVTHIILHHGFVPGTSAPAGWLTRSAEFWQEFVDSKSPNVRFHLENVFEPDPSLISDVVAAIDRPNVDICLDIGHTHCYSKTAALEWIQQLGEQIGYVHMHNNDGQHDLHQAIDDGIVPMLDVCHALNQYSPNATWAIEAAGERREQSLKWLRDNGFLEG